MFFTCFLNAQEPELNMKTPYQTFHSFLYYLQGDTYEPEKAAQALSYQGDQEEKEELAIKLKSVLDGGGFYIILGKLPRDSNYVDSLTGRSVYFPFHERNPQIYLEKYGDKWLFSDETVDAIPAMYDQTFPFGIMRIANKLPAKLQRNFLNVPIWKYLAIPAVLILTIAFFYLFLLVLFFVIKFIGNRFIRHLRGETKLKKRIASYLSFYLALGVGMMFLPGIMLPVKTMNFLVPFLEIIRTIVMIIVVLRLADVIVLYAREYVDRTESKMDDQLLPIFTKFIQFFIIIGGLLNILQVMDVNITALIAGVSIGGLALALAAQDTVKNLIGSSMIFLDKPFQIGDYVVGSGYEGTIEEVGFRTTRLRNIDKSIISIPNGNVANDTITNLGLRPARRMQLSIGLMYNTPPDKIQSYLEGLRNIIESHPKTSKTDYIIRFHSLGASSLDIFFRVYIFAPTLADEFEIREEIIYGVVRLAEKVGVSFAFPSTSVYMEQLKPEEGEEQPVDDRQQSIAAFLDQFEKNIQQKYFSDEEESGAKEES